MTSDDNLTTGAETQDSPGCRLYVFVTQTIVIALLCAFGFVGNSISFYAFAKDKVKTSTLFLFQSLSVIDNFLLLTVFPVYCFDSFVLYTELYKGYISYGWYLIVVAYVFPLASLAQTATVWLTVLVALNRYIAVCKPYQAARLCTVRQAKYQLTIVLALSVLYNLPRFAELYLEVDVAPDNRTQLVANHTLQFFSTAIYVYIYDTAMYMIVMLIIPLVILTVLNIRLVKALKELSRRRAEMQSARQKHDNNVTLVLVIVVLVFIVCQTPALANKFMWCVLPDSARFCGGFQFYFSRLSNILVITNSAVNFVIYFLFNARFRQTICCGDSAKDEFSYKAMRLKEVSFNATNDGKTTSMSTTTKMDKNVGKIAKHAQNGSGSPDQTPSTTLTLITG